MSYETIWLDLDSTYSVSANGVVLDRALTTLKPNKLEWTEISRDFAANPLQNVATYSVNGVVPATRFAVYDNGTWITNHLSTVDGLLTNIVITLDTVHTIQIQGPPTGTMILLR